MKLGAMSVALVAGAILWGEATAERSAESIVRERCHKCHGTTGQSSDPSYPKLAGQNADYLTRQLANFRTGVRTNKEMTDQVADLTGGEMRALALYFSSKDLIPDVAFDPALADVGRELYFNGNPDSGVTACVTCHGPEGRGAMYLPRLAGQHAQYIRKQIHAFLDHSRSSPDLVMHKVVENMTEPEIEAAAQYLSGLE
jgi:cytochrome c553